MRKSIIHYCDLSGDMPKSLGIQVNLKKVYQDMSLRSFNEIIIKHYIHDVLMNHGDKQILITLQARIDYYKILDGKKVFDHFEKISDPIPVKDHLTLYEGIYNCIGHFITQGIDWEPCDSLELISPLERGAYNPNINYKHMNSDYKSYLLCKELIGQDKLQFIGLENLKSFS